MTSAGSPVSSSVPNRAVGMPSAAEELLLAEPVLPLLERRAGRARLRAARAASTGTFSNSNVTTSAPSREPARGRRVAVVRHDELADLPRARVGRRVEEAKGEAERQPRQPEHPPELAAADARDERHHERRVEFRHKPHERHAGRIGAVEHRLRLRRAEAAEAVGERRVRAREDRRGEERGVDGAGAADRERPDRDAGGHLDDREQRVHPGERLRLDRDAEHGQRRLRRGHAGEVRGAAGAGDQHAQAALLGRSRRTRRAGRASGAPRRRAARTGPRARRASPRRAASSPSRSGSP